MLVCLKLY
jgi:hypothetical protein